jgi:regulator of cell morphogenesis and NO signaling
MTTLASEIPVGQLVAERPRRARLFDRLGIDYCGGGRMPLDQACQAKGLNVNDILHELATSDAQSPEDDRIDWAGATMGELADHIVAVHHSFLRQELPRLAAHVDQVASVHGERHPELREVREVFASLKEELESHMLKEEKILFPIIKQLEVATRTPRFHCGSVNNPIRVMEHEHKDAGAALARLRELTDGYAVPTDACNTYRAMLAGLADLETDLHRHIHKENEILFPRALATEAALLTEAD